MVFMGMLADANGKDLQYIRYTMPYQLSSLPSPPLPSEATQEVASRGMGLVYELSGPAHREELVGMLVDTLMEGRRLVVS